MKALLFNLILICLNFLNTVKGINWNESFESYSNGTFPSSWIKDGNASNNSYNYVTNTTSSDGSKSLKLYGTSGGCWAALVYKSLDVSSPFFIEIDIRNGNESLTGCHPERAGIGLRKGTSWTNPSRSFVQFDGDGFIYLAGSKSDAYITDSWYKIKVKYEKKSSEQVKLSFWINNEFKGEKTVPTKNDEDLLTNLELNVQEGTAWFDNIKVYKFHGEPCPGTPTVIDYDGNIYNTVQIGNQCWTKENLKTTSYSDGTLLIDGTGVGYISNDSTTKYYFSYNDDPAYTETYGYLYTWAAAMNGSEFSNENPSGIQGLCPSGWHVPSYSEWDELESYLGYEMAGGKLKSDGTEFWNYPNTGATNESGFTALPSGSKAYNGVFNGLGERTFFWSSSREGSLYFRNTLRYNYSDLSGAFDNRTYGHSVRCIKNSTIQRNNWIGIYNVISNNSTFPGRLPLWEDSTNNNLNQHIKICADGSRSTKFVFVNNNPSINSNNIRFVVESNQTSEDLDRNGYFTGYEVSDNKITAYFNHPQFLEGNYVPYRNDELKVIESSTPKVSIFNIPIRIYRAPVVMIHGLWGDPSSFNDKDNENNLKNVLRVNLYHDPNLLYVADYTASNDLNFKSNEYEVYAAINETFDKLRDLKYSVGKVDIIAHSMGGILARTYLQADYYRNDIHKLITLNTPHSGTQIANFLLGYENTNWAVAVSLKMTKGKKPDSYLNGAVNDLRYNSPVMLNNFIEGNTNLNKNIVPTHVIRTRGVSDDCNLLAMVLGYIAGTNPLFVTVFNFDEHDLIVPFLSQTGGVNTFTSINNQCHLGVADNSEVQDKLIQLLNQNPNNELYFTVNGFHPPLLSSLLYKSDKTESGLTENTNFFKSSTIRTKAASTLGQIEITQPSSGSIFHSGENINISIESTGQVNRLALVPLFGCSGCSDENPKDTFATNAVFIYKIPEEFIGEATIMALGFDSTEFVAYDTLSINVLSNAILDSIDVYEDSLTLSIGRSKSLKVLGYYNDGIVRDISTSSNFMSDEQQIAKNIYSNFIEGINEGNTIIHAIYNGKTNQVPVKVLRGDTVAIPPLMTPPDSIEASDGIFKNKIEITWKKVGEACYYQVYRNTTNDTIGALLISNWNIDNFYVDSSIISNETYHYWIKVSTSTYGSNETKFSLPDSGYAACLVPILPEEITGETNPIVNNTYNYETMPLTGVDSFNWNATGGNVSGDSNAVSVIWTSLGIQTLFVEAVNNCGSSDATILNVTVVNSTTGIVSTKTENTITIYPNPFNDEIFIGLNNFDKIVRLELYNVLGDRVKIISDIYLTNTILDLAKLKKGIYGLKVYTKGSIFYKNILKL